MMNVDNTVSQWGNYRVIRYTGNNFAEIKELYKNQNADGIGISSRLGYSESSLHSLHELPELKIVLIRELPNLKMDGLQGLHSLEEISLDTTSQELDFSWVPTLKRLTCDWDKNLFRNTEISSLQSLSVGKYKSKKGDLSDFPNFPRLEKIELLQSTIQKLTGINRFPMLREIHLTYLSKLEELGRLNLPHLREFVAEKCKRISDHGQIGNCLSLQELKLHECGTIKSLDFINHLKKLESFRFINTNVLDGDLSPLKRLQDVYFTEKRHFSGKVKDFKQTPKQWNTTNQHQ